MKDFSDKVLPIVRGTCGVINDISSINDQLQGQNSQRGFNNQQFNPQYPQFNPQYPQFTPQYPQFNPQYPKFNPQYPQFNPQYPQFNPQYPQYNPQVNTVGSQQIPSTQAGSQGGEVSNVNPNISLEIPKMGTSDAAFPDINNVIPEENSITELPMTSTSEATPGPELKEVIDSIFAETTEVA